MKTGNGSDCRPSKSRPRAKAENAVNTATVAETVTGADATAAVVDAAAVAADAIVTTPLARAVRHYPKLNRNRFHVPGHSGREIFSVPGLTPEAHRHDLTELEGMDVLSEPSGCIAEAQRLTAERFGVRDSFFLVNGSTAGLQAAMLSILKPGDRVLLPRNVHRSVISGLILTGAEPIWFLPEWLPDWGLWGSVSPETVETHLMRDPHIRALVLTSPTYEGLGSDIRRISEICRQHDCLLIVDEAHGSLWPFSNRLPASACRFDCDAVVHSLHKSAGSLTQSAVAHLPETSRIDPGVFQQALNTLQTTSPSYLLLASLDAASAFLGSDEGRQRIEAMLDQVIALRGEIQREVTGFRLFEPAGLSLWDPTQLYLVSRHESGEDWGVRVEEAHGVSFESVNLFGTLYKAGIGLEPQDYRALLDALKAEDAVYVRENPAPFEFPDYPVNMLPEMVLLPRDAFFAPGTRLPADDAVGRIARETVVHCPPGIPVLMPGERIRERHRSGLPETVLVVQD